MARITGTQTLSLCAQRSCTPLRSGKSGQDVRWAHGQDFCVPIARCDYWFHDEKNFLNADKPATAQSPLFRRRIG